MCIASPHFSASAIARHPTGRPRDRSPTGWRSSTPQIRSATTLPFAGSEYSTCAAANAERRTATSACCATSAAFRFFEWPFNFPSAQSNPLESTAFAIARQRTAHVQNQKVRPNFATALPLNAIPPSDNAQIYSDESQDHGADRRAARRSFLLFSSQALFVPA